MSSLAPLKQVVIVQYDFDLKAYECLVSLKHFSTFEASSDRKQTVLLQSMITATVSCVDSQI